MRTSLIAWLAGSVFIAACGSSGPSQAQGPRPDPDAPAKGASTGDSPQSAAIGDAQTALQAKDFATAREKAQSVLATHPTDAEALFVVGVCDENDGNKDAAVDHYKQAIASDPKLFSAAINLSGLLIDLKRYDEAVEVARAAIGKGGKGLAELHINLAYGFKGQGKHDAAAKSFGNAIVLRPDNVELYLWQGEALLDSGDKEAAAHAYKNAVARAGDDTEVLALAAIGLVKSGDATGCVSALDGAIAKKPSGDLLTDRAICKHVGKDLAGARADLDAAIAKSPSYRAYFAAGKYAEEASDKKACRGYYDQAAKIAAGKPGEKEAKDGVARCK